MTAMIRLTAACLFMLGVSACNTVEGFGQDVERVGEEIEDAAN